MSSSTASDLQAQGDPPIHAFVVLRDQSVLDVWRDISERNKHGKADTAPSRTQEEVSFGQTSPLTLNAPRNSTSQSNNSVHAKRWASYSNLPASFDQNVAELADLKTDQESNMMEVQTARVTPKESSPEELRWAAYNTPPKQLDKQAAISSEHSSTMEGHSNQKQEVEYKPLLELFHTQLAELASPSSLKTNVSPKVGGNVGNYLPYPAGEFPHFAFTRSRYDHSTQCNLAPVSPPRTSKVGPALTMTSSPQPERNALKTTLRPLGDDAKARNLTGSHKSSALDHQPNDSQCFGLFDWESGGAIDVNSYLAEIEINASLMGEALLKPGNTSSGSDEPRMQNIQSNLQESKVLEYLKTAEEQYLEHFHEQTKTFEIHLESEAKAFQMHLATQRKTFESFLESQKTLLMTLSEGSREKSPHSVVIPQDKKDETVVTPDVEHHPSMPNKNASFQSLSDSALNEFDLDALIGSKPVESSTASMTNLIDVSTDSQHTAKPFKPLVPENEKQNVLHPEVHQQPLGQLQPQTSTIMGKRETHEATKNAIPSSKTVSIKDDEEKDAWEMLAQYFSPSKSQSSLTPPSGTGIIGTPLRHRQSWHPSSATSEITKPSLLDVLHGAESSQSKFHKTKLAQDLHLPRHNSAAEAALLPRRRWRDRSTAFPMPATQHYNEGTKKRLSTNRENEAALKSERQEPPRGSLSQRLLPIEPQIPREPTLWQASCLFDGSMNTRNYQDHPLSIRHASHVQAELTQENLDKHRSQNNGNKLGHVNSEHLDIGGANVAAPSIPPKPARLQHIPTKRPDSPRPCLNHPLPVPIPKETQAPEGSNWERADSFAKLMRKVESDFPSTSPSLLEGHDIESTLESLLFPQTVRSSQTVGKDNETPLANTARTLPPRRSWHQIRNNALLKRQEARASNRTRADNDRASSDWPFGHLEPPQSFTQPIISNTTSASAPTAITFTPSSLKFPTYPGHVAIGSCVARLFEMGFPLERAETVAVAVDGDFEKAIEMFEEDERVWRSRMKGKGRASGEGGVPGGWDERAFS